MRAADLTVPLRHLLEDRAPAPGDRLPAERSLARELGCSRQTLRAALAVLEREGLIWRHVGQGTFRGPAPRQPILRETLLMEAATPADLIRARLTVEPEVAAEVARRAGGADVAFLADRIADGRGAPDRAACERADSDFHLALARLTRNPLLVGMLVYLSNVRRHSAWQREWDRRYRLLSPTAFQTAHSDQHQAIVDAIAARDPEGAAAAMTRHLRAIGTAFGL